MEYIREIPSECLYAGEAAGVWSGWSSHGDREVVREAAAKGTHVELAHKCLAYRRRCAIAEAKKYFADELEIWIDEMLAKRQIHRASHILGNARKNPLEFIRERCVECREPKLRRYLADYVLSKKGFEARHEEAWNVIKSVALLEEKNGSEESLMGDWSIEEICQLPDDVRSALVADLHFNAGASSCFTEKLKASVLWDYLLANNKIDLIVCWIDAYYRESAEVADVEEAEEEISLTSKIFRRLAIDEEMIERVANSGATSAVKELVLDRLSGYGILTREERQDVRSVLGRFFSNRLTPEVFSSLLASSSSRCTVESTEFARKIFSIIYQRDASTESRGRAPETGSLLESMTKLVPGPEVASLKRAIVNNVRILDASLDAHFLDDPILLLTLLLLEHKTGSDRDIASDFRDIVKNDLYLEPEVISGSTIRESLKKIPYLATWLEDVPRSNETTTMYDLLNGHEGLDVARSFEWRDRRDNELPNFRNENLAKKYGREEKLSYVHYLRESRPSMAVRALMRESLEVKVKTRRDEVTRDACDNAKVNEGIELETEVTGSDEIKVNDVVDEVKVNDKVDEVRVNDKVDEVRVSDKVDEVRVSDGAKVNDKVDEVNGVKVNDKVNEVKVNDKADEVNDAKVNDTVDEVKVNDKVDEVKVNVGVETKVTGSEESKVNDEVNEVKANNEVKVSDDGKADDEVKFNDEVKVKAEADEVKVNAEPDEVKANAEADGVKVNDEADEVEVNDEAEEVKANDEADEVKFNDETDEVKANAEADEVKVNAEPNEVKANAEADEVKANDEADEVKVSDEADEVKATVEVGKAKNSEKADEVRPKPAELKVNISDEVKFSDEFDEVEVSDEVGVIVETPKVNNISDEVRVKNDARRVKISEDYDEVAKAKRTTKVRRKVKNKVIHEVVSDAKMEMKIEAAAYARGLALELGVDEVTCACVAFIELLGLNSDCLRVDASARAYVENSLGVTISETLRSLGPSSSSPRNVATLLRLLERSFEVNLGRDKVWRLVDSRDASDEVNLKVADNVDDGKVELATVRDKVDLKIGDKVNLDGGEATSVANVSLKDTRKVGNKAELEVGDKVDLKVRVKGDLDRDKFDLKVSDKIDLNTADRVNLERTNNKDYYPKVNSRRNNKVSLKDTRKVDLELGDKLDLDKESDKVDLKVSDKVDLNTADKVNLERTNKHYYPKVNSRRNNKVSLKDTRKVDLELGHKLDLEEIDKVDLKNGDKVDPKDSEKVNLSVGDEVGNKVDLKVGDKVDLKIGDKVDLKVGDKVDLKVVDKVGDKVDLKVVDKVELKVVDKVDLKIGDKVDLKIVDKVDLKIVDKVDLKIGDKVVDKIGDKVDLKVVDKVELKVVDKVDLKIGDKVDLKVVDKVDLKIGDKVDLKIGDKVVDKVGDKVDLKVVDKVDLKVGDKVVDKVVDKVDLKVDLRVAKSFVDSVKTWETIVRFARIHETSLPRSFLRLLARADRRLEFVLVGQLFAYPLDAMLASVRYFANSRVREHLSLAMMNERLLVTTTTTTTRCDHEARNFHEFAEQLNDEENNDLWTLILRCNGSQDPPGAFVEASKISRSPILNVLAACYEPSASSVFCWTWLVVSIGTEKLLREYDILVREELWSARSVRRLLRSCIDLGYVGTISRAFEIFIPSHPLACLFLAYRDFPVDNEVHEESVILMWLRCFVESCKNFAFNPVIEWDNPANDDYLWNSRWIVHVAVESSWNFLATSATSSLYLTRVFLELHAMAKFNEELHVGCPNFCVLKNIVDILDDTGVKFDFHAIELNDDRGSNVEREIHRCVEQLLVHEDFENAIALSKVAGLRCSNIILAKYRSEFKRSDENDGKLEPTFWKRCAEDLKKYEVSFDETAAFFIEYAEKVLSHRERYEILKLALESLRPIVTDKKTLDTVEMAMWKSCVLAGPDTTEIEKANGTFDKLKAELYSGIGDLRVSCTLNDATEENAVKLLISRFVAAGQLATALRISAIFNYKHRDLQILMLCLSLAEGEISPYQLTSQQRSLLSETGRMKIQKYSTLRNRGLHRASPAISAVSTSSPSLNEETSHFVIQQIQLDSLTMIDRLTKSLESGTAIGTRILLCAKLAIYLRRSYQSLLCHVDPMKLLYEVVGTNCERKLEIVGDIVAAYRVKSANVAKFLAEEIVANTPRLVEESLEDSLVMWGNPLGNNIQAIIDLCSDPSLLGWELLRTANLSLGNSHGERRNVLTLKVAIELLIRSHDCFTASCSMEGIASILRKAQHLAYTLQHRKHWSLLVRLVTGLGRFTEMNYVFQILKENDQFEFLLGKGLDKIPGLKTALLEFCKRQCPGDKELFTLIALHFTLYNEIAYNWESEAREITNEIVAEARKSSPRSTSGNFIPLRITRNESVEKRLQVVVENFTHATEYYLQDNKLNLASRCSRQAQLAALQISLVSGVGQNHQAICLFNLGPEELNRALCQELTVPQSLVLLQAYNCHGDWSSAIYTHVVVNGETRYLKEFLSRRSLTAAIVQDCVCRYRSEKTYTRQMTEYMELIVSELNDVECKYVLASQLGFKRIVEEMLANPSTGSYLKDTVWKQGFKSTDFYE